MTVDEILTQEFALQAREEAERPKITKDDSDLCEIDSYLDMPAIKA